MDLCVPWEGLALIWGGSTSTQLEQQISMPWHCHKVVRAHDQFCPELISDSPLCAERRRMGM
jgi:hypothetical protein